MMKIVIKRYIFEVDIDYPKALFKWYSDLPFLPKRKKNGKVEKCICGIEDVKE